MSVVEERPKNDEGHASAREIRLGPAWLDDGRVARLADELGTTRSVALGFLVLVVLDALASGCRDGRFMQDRYLIEQAAGWEGDRGELLYALDHAGLVTYHEEVLACDEWSIGLGVYYLIKVWWDITRPVSAAP